MDLAPSPQRGSHKLRLLLPCPATGNPLFAIIPGGLSFKCHCCRGFHVISRERLAQIWQELERVMTERQVA